MRMLRPYFVIACQSLWTRSAAERMIMPLRPAKSLLCALHPKINYKETRLYLQVRDALVADVAVGKLLVELGEELLQQLRAVVRLVHRLAS